MLGKTKLLGLVLALVLMQFVNANAATTLYYSTPQTTTPTNVCSIILIVQGLVESETHTLEKEVFMIRVEDPGEETIIETTPTGEIVTIDLSEHPTGIYKITITYSNQEEQVITFMN